MTNKHIDDVVIAHTFVDVFSIHVCFILIVVSRADLDLKLSGVREFRRK